MSNNELKKVRFNYVQVEFWDFKFLNQVKKLHFYRFNFSQLQPFLN